MVTNVWKAGRGALGVLPDSLALLAEAGNVQLHDVTGFEVDRIWLDPHANTGRRACGDDIARVQCHELRQMTDDLCHAENHRGGIAGLHALSVHIERHIQRLRIWDLVAGHQKWAGGAEGVAAFALGPLTGQLGLEMPLGDVIDDTITGHMRQGLLFGDIFSSGADDHAQLNLPIRMGGAAGHDHIIIGSNDG